MARLLVPGPLQPGRLQLPAGAARHLKVLRLRPGDALTLFDGSGGEWQARLAAEPDQVELLQHLALERELEPALTLAVGMPANERMDALVEKATELGAAALQPLMTARSVLKLDGERAARRTEHWRGVAAAACEQCGRNRLPSIALPLQLSAWLGRLPAAAPGTLRLLLAAPSQGRAASLTELGPELDTATSVLALSGPEGGFSSAEIGLAQQLGFQPLSLGARVLRADTAPLALLAALAARRA